MGWYELPDEDQPPERIWLDDAKITEHFEAVRQRRESQAGASGGADWDPNAQVDTNDLIPASLRRK